MNCKVCSGKLKVCNTYVTPDSKTQRLECVDCLIVHTGVILIVNVDPGRGQGAAALARRIKAGEEIKLDPQ